MKKYIIEPQFEYFLYDKIEQKCIRKFLHMYEIRDYISKKLGFKDDRNWSWKILNGSYMIEDLSMDFEIKYDELGAPVERYVIIDPDMKIFNYTEIVNELVAMHDNHQINFGIGKTYPGDAFNLPTRPRPIVRMGRKRRHKSRCTLIVNKAERVATNSNIKMEFYSDISDEIKDEHFIEIDPFLIKKAYNSMRSYRKALSKYGGYTYQRYTYGSSSCWKSRKISHQWKRTAI